jgi:hypothetical protein
MTGRHVQAKRAKTEKDFSSWLSDMCYNYALKEHGFGADEFACMISANRKLWTNAAWAAAEDAGYVAIANGIPSWDLRGRITALFLLMRLDHPELAQHEAFSWLRV